MEKYLSAISGFKLMVMSNPIVTKGTAMIHLHPDDYIEFEKRMKASDETIENDGKEIYNVGEVSFTKHHTI